MSKKEIDSILLALNSTNDLGFKYPIGNRELTLKVKELEDDGIIVYSLGKWQRKKKN